MQFIEYVLGVDTFCKVPLFLGGEDIISNLEYSDMDVSWTVLTQVIESIRR